MSSSCVECRHGYLKHHKIKAGFDRKTGRRRFKMITKYRCGYDNITHAVDQTDCDNYIGHQTLFEYLMYKQPDEVNKLLTRMNLRVVNSRNKWGFDLK